MKTSFQTTDIRDFWEKKILSWEDGRYEEAQAGGLESIANKASDSLRFRIKITGDLLAPHVAGKHIVELGCGSGLLAARLLEAGAASYTGYDIAQTAIDRARANYQASPHAAAIRFETAELGNLDVLNADIVFSLGLLDWLSNEEIAHMFKISGKADFLHAISEKRSSPSIWLHRLYCHIAYGYRTKGYVPRYVSPAEMFALAECAGKRPFYIFRDKRLSFGALLSTLPTAGERFASA